MEFKINTGALLQVLTVLSKVVPQKTPTPALTNFLFEKKGDSVSVTAGDQEITMRTKLKAEASDGEDGSLLLPASILISLLKTQEKDSSVLFKQDDKTFCISWKNGNASLPTFNPDDYPRPDIPSEGIVANQFEQAELQSAIDHCVGAVGYDELRPVFGCLCIDITPEGTTVAATDSRIIMTCECGGPGQNQDRILLPAKQAAALKNTLSGEGPIRVIHSGNKAVFSTKDYMTVCTLDAGKFPDFKSFFAKLPQNELAIGRENLKDSVSRVSLAAERGSETVTLALSPGSMICSASSLIDEKKSTSSRESCDLVSYFGEDITATFKSSMLVKLLGMFTSENVRMLFKDGKSPVYILPQDGEAEAARGLLMPIFKKPKKD